MPTVSTGNGFKFLGVVYQKGDPIPEEVLKNVPPYIYKIHHSKRVIAEMSEDEAAMLRFEREREKEEAVKAKAAQQLARKKVKIVELKDSLNVATSRNACLNKAIARLEKEVAELEPEKEEQPEPEIENEVDNEMTYEHLDNNYTKNQLQDMAKADHDYDLSTAQSKEDMINEFLEWLNED